MPVRRRTDKRRSELSEEVLDWLGGGPEPLFETDAEILAIWEAHSVRINAEHIASSPGTRHPRWWDHDAPRLSDPGKYWHGALPEHRRQIGGSGGRCPALVPHSWCGIPHIDEIDWKDPPVFESEASYLDRHGLLRAGERRRLKPADFEPVTLVPAGSVGSGAFQDRDRPTRRF